MKGNKIDKAGELEEARWETKITFHEKINEILNFRETPWYNCRNIWPGPKSIKLIHIQDVAANLNIILYTISNTQKTASTIGSL